MLSTFENGLPIDVISAVLFDVDPVQLKKFDVHEDEYLWEAELLQSVPTPISAEDVFMVFHSMFNTLTNSETGQVSVADIVHYGDWCQVVADRLNLCLEMMSSSDANI